MAKQSTKTSSYKKAKREWAEMTHGHDAYVAKVASLLDDETLAWVCSTSSIQQYHDELERREIPREPGWPTGAGWKVPRG